MLTRWSVWFLVAVCLCLVACGQKVKDSIAPLNTSAQFQKAGTQQIVILPLADYTVGIRPDDALRRQVKIHDALMYCLAKKGFYVPIEEDVVQYLADLGVIRIIKPSVTHTDSSYREVMNEMGGEWSGEMRKEIEKLMVKNRDLSGSKEGFEVTKVGLNPGTIEQIGRYFGANYVLRGRIVEYEVRQGQTLNPIQQGILPFFFDTSSAALFGVAESGKYDLWQNLSIGSGIGALFGSHGGTPFNAPHKETKISNASHPRFATRTSKYVGGYEKRALLNATVWGAAGATAAYLASKGGRISQAVVQLSLALQDAHSGRIVWINRVEKEVEPVSMWADPTVRTQIDRAVEEAAGALVANLTEALSNSAVDDHTAISNMQPISIPQKNKKIDIQKISNPIIKNQQKNEQKQEDPAILGS